MPKKFTAHQMKSASLLLKKINVTKNTAQYFTQFSDLDSLLKSNNAEVPPVKYFLDDMKKQGFTPCHLLKCAVVIHFFFQSQIVSEYAGLTQFATYLFEKCNLMLQFLGNNCTLTEPNCSKTVILAKINNQDEAFWMGKTCFLIKQIIRPYLAYVLKLAAFIRQQPSKQPFQREICEVWRDINLLNSISGFTSNFTTIGRYYFQQLGAFVVLLSQILSVDVKKFYERIQGFIQFNERLLCVYSHKKEEQTQVQEFRKVLQEIGFINQKFNQFYMGKYFYSYLQHLKQPKWIDVNSTTFDRIFKESNKQNYENPPKKSSGCRT